MINYCMGYSMNAADIGKTKMSVFKVTKDDLSKRVKIADILTPKGMKYEHSFRVTSNYAIIFDHPWYLSLPDIIEGYTLIEGGLY